jgi:diphosphomevalonate decarboxylase
MTDSEFVQGPYAAEQDEGNSGWQAPSNIALIKYWGKTEPQLPANPSISFTLSGSVTRTRVSFRRRKKADSDFSFDVLLDGKTMEGFRPKIQLFFGRALPYLPFLKNLHFTIETSNSFPHSSGIASSASGMAALSLCLVDLERQWGVTMDEALFRRKASFIARLGSGSASRSIDGPLVLWGSYTVVPGSTDLYAIPYPLDIHPVFRGFRDAILLVDKGQKAVSSSLGHGLMHGHPFASPRFAQARANLDGLVGVLAAGDLQQFAEITENEALSLHAMMMTSNPSFILMKPHTLEIIQRIRDFRNTAKVPVCFTLDAGSNVHLLYPESVKETVDAFIKGSLIDFCINKQYICDQIGFGAKKM